VTLVKESQEAKSHFLGTLSHEIKTPITSLTMATRLLRKSSSQFANPSLRHLIELCVDDVDRLRSLLDDLLNVSRFDILTQELDLKEVDIAKLILHSVRSFQLQAGMKGVEINYQNQKPGTPIILGVDATKIAWAFSNLLTNALRHTPRGGKVSISLAVTAENVEVRVQDTGPGIERSRQTRIFDKFRPYYDLRIARSGSVGAGLAIAKELVVAHGGRIWVSSELGHGAEFGFTLPLRGRPRQAISSEPGLKGDLKATSKTVSKSEKVSLKTLSASCRI
jgi:signal transduction histidine kinase